MFALAFSVYRSTPLHYHSLHFMIQLSHKKLLLAAAAIFSIQLLCAQGVSTIRAPSSVAHTGNAAAPFSPTAAHTRSYAAAQTGSSLRTIVTQLTLEEKAAQVLMVNIAGRTEADAASIAAFKGTVPGAIILFGYNIAETAQEVRSFLASANQQWEAAAHAAKYTFLPPLYALDNEGGSVYRTRRITAPLPAAEEIGQRLSVEETEALYRQIGQQMKELGLQLNLAPVAEARTAQNQAALGSRTYSDKPETAAQYAAAAVRGMQDAGICATVKHFPGNGAADLHKGAAILETDYETFRTQYCASFIPSIKAGAAAVLVSHITVPAVEAVPFCFSAKGIALLRNELGFSGLIITDDIAMQALRQNGATPAENAVRAIAAGCDMVMSSLPAVYPLISAIAEKARSDTEFAKRLDEAVLRVLTIKQNE
jgi:glycosyl hydrolase, family 3